ncbi:MAG: anti-sigma F factor [Christensenellaceae bacterium]|jgi:anti-sigma F factor|nr:anti-sigma F factor [Christensenellaceae bacterium]PWL98140.1 MAG: anti-sigma F factor [Selenomonadales bacterium]
MPENKMRLVFDGISENESFARMAVAAFAVQLNPTMNELADIKTAVSEGVTNAIVHGYEGKGGDVEIRADITGNLLHIEIIDEGIGIENVSLAMEPFYTTRADEERSGMGFSVMESFMDKLDVASAPGEGTRLTMLKRIKGSERRK